MLWTVRVTLPGRPGPVADPQAPPPAEVAVAEAAIEPFATALMSFEAEGGRAWTVEGLCEERPYRARLRAALRQAGLGGAPLEIAPLAPRDWVVEAQKSLPPLRIGRFFVHGSHVETPPPRGAVPLLVDPGLAFGTGHHETTRGCLLMLDALARERAFRRPLDLGCGSGILALAMARLWGRPVVAADNDPKAVAVARENARLNGVGRLVRVLRSDGFAAPALRRAGPFDVVTANILADPLIGLAPALARHLAPRGVVVLSGLLRRQERAVLAAYAAQGLALVRRRRLGPWSVLALAGPSRR
ncbi:MAG: 50S ribosomal protein L11 methyltransferase [Rhodospirillaceae bacterium]|nr:50S ribosomal protein L11 methyltransferase [Rhodospirillaceae bacterium]